jgi:hypothetical protein
MVCDIAAQHAEYVQDQECELLGQIEQVLLGLYAQVEYIRQRYQALWMYRVFRDAPAWTKYRGVQVFSEYSYTEDEEDGWLAGLYVIFPRNKAHAAQMEALGFEHAVELHINPEGSSDERYLQHINTSDEVVLIRAEGYMAKAQTLRKLVFLNAEGESVKVTYTFPVLRRYLSIFREWNGSGLIWYEVDTTKYQHAYALPFQDTNTLVTGDHSFRVKYAKDRVHAKWGPFDPAKHRITMSNYTNYCWCGCGAEEGERTDFDMNWEVILCEEEVATFNVVEV